MSGQVFVVGVVLVMAVLAGRLVAGRTSMPEAAAYVLVGVAAGFLPGMSEVQLSPDLVLLVFLPPLVHYAAFLSDPRETMDHAAPVVAQSVGLVLATAVAAGGTLLALFPEVGWAGALAFGAAVAPPDVVAATNVLNRMGVPGRLVTVLEGEGLVNDGVALTLFSLAVASMGGLPSVGGAFGRLALEVGGGIGMGLVIGIAVAWLRKRTRDMPSQVLLSLATPYLAFVPAHLVHASGVLATVTAAGWLGTKGHGVVTPTNRFHSEVFWRVLNVLLVAFLFVLLGLQVPGIVAGVRHLPVGPLVVASVALVAVVVVVRLVWALAVPALLARLSWSGEAAARLSVRERVALGWCGPRGAVSLAVALSIPTTSGARRDLLVFCTVVVVLATLVGQVAPLPAVLRVLRLSPGERERTEALRARRRMVDAALSELDGLSDRERRDQVGVEALRQVFELRRDRLLSRLDVETGDGEPGAEPVPDDRTLRLRLVDTERRTLRRLYRDGEITGRTLGEISRELDLDETRLRGAH